MVVMPTTSGTRFATVVMEGETYVYRKEPESAAAGDSSSGIFSSKAPFQAENYFSRKFGRLQALDPAGAYTEGLAAYCAAVVRSARDFFRLDPESPARDNAIILNDKYPDSTAIDDKQPDMGALEILTCRWQAVVFHRQAPRKKTKISCNREPVHND